MLRFQRHGKIQESVAEELGLFKAVGLDYEDVHHRLPGAGSGKGEDASAYRDFVHGSRSADIASTSHWAVQAAVDAGHGRLWPHAYSIMPAGIYVQPSLSIARPSDLKGLEIVVGRHSGSHFSAAYALEKFLPRDEIRLKFVAGRAGRLRCMMHKEVPAGSMYGPEAYLLEQQGFVKVLDTSFMVSFMLVGTPSETEVEKYFTALRLAQRAIDEDPNRYKHYLLTDFPKEQKPQLDVLRGGIGERLVFDSYTPELAARTGAWVATGSVLDVASVTL